MSVLSVQSYELVSEKPNILFCFCLSRNGVIARAAPGVAAQQPAHGQIEPLERPVLLYGLTCILGAGGCEPARRRCVGGDEVLIEQDG